MDLKQGANAKMACFNNNKKYQTPCSQFGKSFQTQQVGSPHNWGDPPFNEKENVRFHNDWTTHTSFENNENRDYGER